MTRRYLHKRTIFVMVSIVALLLSACGSSSEPEGLPTKVAPVAAAQQEAATAVPVATETPAPTVAPTEPLRYPETGESCATDSGPSGLNCAGFGSSVCVTSVFGMAAAAHAIQTIIAADKS